MQTSFGIIGCGKIAKSFAYAVNTSRTGKLVAAAARDSERAGKFAAEWKIPRAYGSYEELLRDSNIDTVYIALPHPFHKEWAIKAAEAGKHLLVEKPIGINRKEAEEIIAAARKHDVFLMEAFKCRCHPQTQAIAERIADKAIGEIRLIRAMFSFNSQVNPDSRLFNLELGGGAIMDVGCYPAAMVRRLAGAAVGKQFDNPTALKAAGRFCGTGADIASVAAVQFDSGILGELETGLCYTGVGLSVHGSKGIILVDQPWAPLSGRRVPHTPGTSIIKLIKNGKEEDIHVPCDHYIMSYEVDCVTEFKDRRQCPHMSWQDTLGNMDLLDRWRREIGLAYPQD